MTRAGAKIHIIKGVVKMKLNMAEWNTIKLALQIAKREHEKQRNESKTSSDENSLYQIVQRQAEKDQAIIDKIESYTF